MRIQSIEPTPNPNNIKINLDEALPEGTSYQASPRDLQGAPEHLRRLMAIPGVKSAYQVADFIALERSPKAAWRPLLAAVARALEEGDISGDAPSESDAADPLGEIQVFVQMFRGLPMQVKLQSGLEQARAALPERFKQVAMKAAEAAQNVVHERQWVEYGLRYGDMDEVGREVVQQIDAAYDQPRLTSLLEQALRMGPGEAAPADHLPVNEVLARLESADWKERYAALDRLELSAEALPAIDRALEDGHPAVRRLAVVYLGALEEVDVLSRLLPMLEDPVVGVRRATGDVLSDLGDTRAMAAMCRALQDSSKLVRWRAARFLYEVGDNSVLSDLRRAADDPEFEVALQAKMAIDRIEGGHATTEPVWKMMTRGL